VKYRHDVRFLVHIVEKASLATRTYWPCFWAFNRHAQTVVLNMLGHLEWMWTHVHWRHETVPAVDGNVLDVYWASTDGDRAGGDALSHFASSAMPIAVLVPGIGGDIQDPYIKRMARACLANGWRVATHAYWRLDFHNTTDLTSVLEAIAADNPAAPMVAIAFSAGGHLLMRHLQTAGKGTPLVAAVTVSGCFDLLATMINVQDNENRAYELFLNSQVRSCIARHIAHDQRFRATRDAVSGNVVAPPAIDAVEFRRKVFGDNPPVGGDAMGEYDRFLFHLGGYIGEADAIAAHRAAGFTDGGAGEWKLMTQTLPSYKDTAARCMGDVRVTTLVLHADDDPIVSARFVDWPTVLENEHLIVAHTKRGGHVSWYTGVSPWGDDWGCGTAIAFISALLETHAQTGFLLEVVRESMRVDPTGVGGAVAPAKFARILSKSDLASFAAPSRR
jgi:predicted alpha/beta-fold hydrolase